MSARAWIAVLFLLACAWRTHEQATVWQSDLTLWRHAAQLAPFKPRPALNYGSALAQAGQVDEAQRWWRYAAALAQQPHIPAWDARRTTQSAQTNLQRLQGPL